MADLSVETYVSPIDIGAGGANYGACRTPLSLVANPAGLPCFDRNMVDLSIGRLSNGFDADVAAFGYLSKSKFGVFYVHMGADGFEQRSFLVSHGREFGPGLMLGASAKYYALDMPAGADNVSGGAVDFGLMYQTQPEYSMGFSLKNVIKTDDEISTIAAAGLRYDLREQTRFFINVQSTIDVQAGMDKTTRFHGGIDHDMNEKYSLRAGYYSNDGGGDGDGFSVGASYNNPTWNVDYAGVFSDTDADAHFVGIRFPVDNMLKSDRDEVASAPRAEPRRPAPAPAPAGGAPYMAVKTFGPSRAEQGETLEFAILFENMGDGTAHSTSVVAELPSGVRVRDTEVFGLAIEGLTANVRGNRVSWDLGDVRPGDTGELNAILEITDAFDSRNLHLSATMRYKDPGGADFSSLESNVTSIAVRLVEKDPPPPVVAVRKSNPIKGLSISGETLMVNTDFGIPYHDIRGHWAENILRELKAMGLLTPFPGGRFEPNRAVSKREFFELLLLGQMYREYGQPLELYIELERAAKVRVAFDSRDNGIYEEYFAKVYDEGGVYRVPITGEEIAFLAITPGNYTLTVEAVDRDGDKYTATGEIRIIGTEVELSRQYFADRRGMAYSVGIRSLIESTGRAGIETSYLRGLLDSDHILTRVDAARAVFNAMGLIVNRVVIGGDPLPGYTDTVWAHGFRLDPSLLNLVQRPVPSLDYRPLMRGRLAADGMYVYEWDQYMTRAESAAVVRRFLNVDQYDYFEPLPDDLVMTHGVFAYGPGVTITPVHRGAPVYAVKFGHYVNQSAAEVVWQWFEERDIPARILPIYGSAGGYRTYTVAIGVYRDRAVAESARQLLNRHLFVPFGAAEILGFPLPEQGTLFAVPDKVLDIRRVAAYVPYGVEYYSDAVSAVKPLSAPAVYELELLKEPAVTITPMRFDAYDSDVVDPFGYHEKIFVPTFELGH